MTPEELQSRYSRLSFERNLLVEELNEIFNEMSEIRDEYKSLTGKEMLIN